MKKIITLLLFSSLLSGCATFVVPTTNLKNSPITTSYKIPPEKVIVKKPYSDINQVGFVVLKTRNNTDYNKYHDFMKTMLTQVGFEKIINESEFAKLIIDKGVDDKIGSTYDLVSLHKIYKELGPFLTISTSLNHTGNAWWDNQIIIVDPAIPDVLVKVHEHKPNWASLDQEFNYPTINFINDWYESSK